jgi:cholera toxin transcriptional activator
LQQLGADPAVLATLPRIGYRLTSAKRVTPFVDALTSTPLSAETGASSAPFPWDNAQSVSRTENIFEDKSKSSSERVSNDPSSGSTSTTPRIVGEGPASTLGGDDGRQVAPGQPADDAKSATKSTSQIPADARPLRQSWWPATGIWLGVAAVSATLAGWVVPSLRGDLRTNASVAQWAPLDDTPDNRVFIAPDFKQDADFVKQRLARLASTPPLAVDDAHERYVYINGAGSLDVFSYFLCRAPIGRADSECLSYLLIDHTHS